MIPDVNLVLAAARTDHDHHALAKAWWLSALDDATTERPIPSTHAAQRRID
jgi:predicted nucleic acid-binding protein